ncbi:MAG: biotin--[acetyl-CoA-carboxylase] ligase [Prevotellaceae bacterium]|jgi:BirA family biotin operon repressor/biotin-[acetyl-CoA-carboxylase] ligase|nr:biotin--[acetyl-CoA-carboxylase] ligase [Prevotellaceae bacterium]
MKNTYLHIAKTLSTNTLMAEMLSAGALKSGFVIVADFQLAGRGQANSLWESAVGKNLMFSILYRPKDLPAEESFIISQTAALAVKTILDNEIADSAAERFSVKWANDIYFNDKKICGILIENTLQQGMVKHSIIGIGINVNQTVFPGNAPNPVSLSQITGRSHYLDIILRRTCEKITSLLENNNYHEIRTDYFNSLYRRNGFYPFQTQNGETFSAKIFSIENDGKLILETEEGKKREFYFKEVKFM